VKVADLFAEFSFKTNASEQMKLKDFGAAIMDMNLSSVAAAIGIGAAGEALVKFAEQAGKHAQHLQLLNTLTGVSTDELQRWEQMMIRAGGSAADADSALRGLQKMMMDIKLGNVQPGISHAFFGIDMTDDLNTRIAKVAKTLHENLNPELKTWMASQYGISDWVQKVLQTGDYVKELGKADIIDPGTLKDASQTWSEIEATMIRLGNAAERWAVANKEIVDGLLIIVKAAAWAINTVANATEEAKSILRGEFNPMANEFNFGGHREPVANNSSSQTNHMTFNVTGIQTPLTVAANIADAVNSMLRQQKKPQT